MCFWGFSPPVWPVLPRIYSYSYKYDVSKNLYSSGSPGGSVVKESACDAGDKSLIPGQENPPDREMATHSNILAREIPWTKESGELESMRSQKESDMTEWLNHHHPRRRQRERHKKRKEDMLLRHRNDAFTLSLSGVEEAGGRTLMKAF